MKRIVLAAVTTIVVLAVGLFVASKFLGVSVWPVNKTQAAGNDGSTKRPPVTLSLGQFVTNLAEAGRYARISVDLELENEETLRTVSSRMSELKTEIYALLRSKSYADLAGEEGLRQLQKDILERIRKRYPTGVKNVYFSEFLIQ